MCSVRVQKNSFEKLFIFCVLNPSCSWWYPPFTISTLYVSSPLSALLSTVYFPLSSALYSLVGAEICTLYVVLYSVFETCFDALYLLYLCLHFHIENVQIGWTHSSTVKHVEQLKTCEQPETLEKMKRLKTCERNRNNSNACKTSNARSI